MRTLIILSLLMSVSGSAWAMEDCRKSCGGIGYDIASCRQACRCANLLEEVLEALKK